MKMTKETIGLVLEDVIYFHTAMGDAFVMTREIHDEGLLQSAVNAPFQTFGGEDIYPDIFDKSARLCFGLAKNHPFCDGNKRTAVHSMLVFLDVNGIDVGYSQEEMEELILDVAVGRMDANQLADWLRVHVSEK